MSLINCCVRLSLFLALIGCIACSSTSRDSLQKTETLAVIDSIPADSCLAITKAGRKVDRSDTSMWGTEKIVMAPGDWDDLVRVSYDGYSLLVPKVVAAGGSYPGCWAGCQVLFSKSAISVNEDLFAYLARTLAECEKSEGGQQIGCGGDAKPIRVDGAIGALVDVHCGDCIANGVFLKRDSVVYSLAVNIDYRDDYADGLLCRMTRVAASIQLADK